MNGEASTQGRFSGHISLALAWIYKLSRGTCCLITVASTRYRPKPTSKSLRRCIHESEGIGGVLQWESSYQRTGFGAYFIIDSLDLQSDLLNVFFGLLRSVQGTKCACKRLSCRGMVRLGQGDENGSFQAQHLKVSRFHDQKKSAHLFRTNDFSMVYPWCILVI